MKEGKESRCETGIAGFDKLCEGGLISDSINLVLGNAGAGKTTFVLQFLYNGISKSNENGLYVSFESDEAMIQRAGLKQGMDFEALGKKGKFKFLKLEEDMSVEELQSKVISVIKKNDIKRVCFDPLNMMSTLLKFEEDSRKKLYMFFDNIRKLGVCILLAGEADLDNPASVMTQEIAFSKYFADGVVEFYSSGLSGEGDRALRITKMRMTAHNRGPIGMKISAKGIEVSK